MLTPWLLIAILVAGANWAALLALRGRWGRVAVPLAIASLLGAIVGDAIGGRTGLELVRIGSFHLVAACAGAQLAMLMILLLAALAPSGAE